MIAEPVLFCPSLSVGAKTTYAALKSYAWRSEECWPGQKRLAEQVGVSEKTLRGYLGELSAVNLVDIQKRGLGETNVYVLLPLEEFTGLNGSFYRSGTGVSTDKRDAVERDSSPKGEESVSVEPSVGSNLGTEGVDAVWSHYCRVWASWHGRECKLRLTDGRRKKIHSRLRTFTADDLVAALDAVALDDWDKRHVNGNDDLVKLFRNDERVEHWLDLAADQETVVSRESCVQCSGSGVFEGDRCPWCDGTGTV